MTFETDSKRLHYILLVASVETRLRADQRAVITPMTSGIADQTLPKTIAWKAATLLAALIVAMTISPVQAATSTKIKLFGTSEKSSTKLGKFTKWGATLDRYLSSPLIKWLFPALTPR